MIKPGSHIFIFVFILFTLTANYYGQQSPVEIRLFPKRLTNLQDAYPVLSPDGTKILFQSNRTGNSWEIYLMNIDGTGLTQFTFNKTYDGNPVFSPDSKRIVFASERDGDPEIYIMNADGSDQKRLTNQPGDDSHPHWSPDGKRIIFNSARATPDLKADWSQQIHEVFTMNADGGDVRQISRLKTISTYPSYSPDGKKIVFRSVALVPGFRWDLSSAPRNSEIFVMNADGTNAINITNSASYDGWPIWSPDGKRILFSSNRSGPANIGQLYVVNPDGSDIKRITNGDGAFIQASWSSDSKKILAFQHWETEEFGNLVMFEVKGPL